MPLISYNHLGRYTTTEKIVVIPEDPERTAYEIPVGTRLDKIQDDMTKAVYWFQPVQMYMIPDCLTMHQYTEED